MNPSRPQKTRVLAQIREYLEGELADAREKKEDEQARELERLLVMYRFLPTREYGGPDDVVAPATLVELSLEKTRAFYYVAPQGGGLVMRVDEFPVQVVTPQSPLGEAMLGKKLGDEVVVEMRQGTRRYRVVSIA